MINGTINAGLPIHISEKEERRMYAPGGEKHDSIMRDLAATEREISRPLIIAANRAIRFMQAWDRALRAAKQ